MDYDMFKGEEQIGPSFQIPYQSFQAVMTALNSVLPNNFLSYDILKVPSPPSAVALTCMGPANPPALNEYGATRIE